jgi:methylmalonyl-CoA mutase cobalamin-binding subunit
LALLLGGQSSFPPHVRYYQRLLAGDESEARAWLEQYLLDHDAESLADRMIIPALRLARLDRKRGALNAEEEQGIFAATERLLQRAHGLKWWTPPADGGVWRVSAQQEPPDRTNSMESSEQAHEATDAALVTVIGCPAHHVAEGLIQAMIAPILRATGIAVRTATCKALPVDIVAAVQSATAPIVFISVLPPRGLPQARYLCEAIRRVDPHVPIVVGYWGNKGRFDHVLVSLRKAGASYVTTSLAQSRSQIEYLAERQREQRETEAAEIPHLTG